MRRADEGRAQEGRTREVARHGEVMVNENGVVNSHTRRDELGQAAWWGGGPDT